MYIIHNKKCAKCSMVGTYSETINNSTYYYCKHHATTTSTVILHSNQESMLQKLLPLLSIFGVITVLTVLTIILKQEYTFMAGMMYMMAYFFIVFGVFKIVDLKGFADAYVTYDLVAQKSKIYAFLYPFIELGLGVLYFFSLGGIYRDLFTFIIMAVSTLGVWKALEKKDEIKCACLGTVFSVPMTKVTLFENLFMMLMSLYMVVTTLTMGHMTM